MDTTRSNPPAERPHRLGFTLIELLVVIAIVTILVGIIVPSIAAVRRRGDAAVCLSRLAQYGRAHHLYADANHGSFVPIHVEPDFADPWYGDFRYRKLLGLPIDAAAEAEGKTNGGGTSSLGGLVCPALPARFRDKGHRHYGMNLNYETPDGRGEMLVVKRSEVVLPSEKIQMTDASTYAVWVEIAYPHHWDVYGEPPDGVHGFVAYRHGRTANVLHFDGSARPYRGEALFFGSGTPEADRIWNILR